MVIALIVTIVVIDISAMLQPNHIALGVYHWRRIFVNDIDSKKIHNVYVFFHLINCFIFHKILFSSNPSTMCRKLIFHRPSITVICSTQYCHWNSLLMYCLTLPTIISEFGIDQRSGDRSCDKWHLTQSPSSVRDGAQTPVGAGELVTLVGDFQ